jgi:hypothetical protein
MLPYPTPFNKISYPDKVGIYVVTKMYNKLRQIDLSWQGYQINANGQRAHM